MSAKGQFARFGAKRIVTALGLLGAMAATAAAQGVQWTDQRPDGTTNCKTGEMITEVRCKGSYCGAIGIVCKKVLEPPYQHQYWTVPYVSDESNRNTLSCEDPNHPQINYFITGFKCMGKNCDNIQIQCTAYSRVARSQRNDSDTFFSEEQGRKVLPSGYYPTRVYCRGDYCDDMKFETYSIVKVPPGPAPTAPIQ